ncbi:M1 family aminopeptidase [Flavobacterium taihuense]|uniref:T9SS type A sorting domain-containing protein n=1 Tax=Flavobacterium taihuense TaxID=2857508 RepID=A0ABS6XWW0_9FLAO|nr:M1 family aminopeptidase [Flavobacterium taihuense]MBW4361155.1 T9SS type A sorting domain-containing protein [Flavobacterium taihuense]
MKKSCFLIVLLVFFLGHAQKKENQTQDIAVLEQKMASKKMNLRVNPNTQNYDITYHELRFSVDPVNYYISGVVKTTFTALSNLSTVIFDLTNQLIVSSVTKDGLPLAFTQNSNNELVITLPNSLNSGTSATVIISYAGAPANGEQAFTTSVHDGSPVLYTLSEPYGARDWWPCKQDLNDKADSIDVYITAPSQYISVANGIETTMPIISGPYKTTHFHHGYPIPAYLIAIAVTNYSVYNQMGGTAPNQYPIINYIYPETLTAVKTQLDQTPLILNLYENLFEIYPFHNEKYGHAQFGWGGGMEHTTVSFMVSFERDLIAHEMAHQWFGDKITCGSWKDIWLNEGFATYLAAMVIENFDGQTAFVTEKNKMISNITSKTNGAVYLTDAELTDVNRIFSSRLTYNKGAMVLNMLRFKMGDALFFQGVKNYLKDVSLAYKYAKTPDLQSHLEAVYGSSLEEFFNDWIYNQGYPIYNIKAQNLGGGQAKFTINQTQSDASVSFFEMPVPIRVFGTGGQQLDLVLNNTVNGESFTENVPFTITSIIFDPNKNIISKSNAATLGRNNFELTTAQLSLNQTNDILTLNLTSGITIDKTVFYNVSGQKIKTTNSATSWDISSWTSGVYFMKVETDFGTKKLKFVKN